jgi:predicted RNase H-like HicB family nuclease
MGQPTQSVVYRLDVAHDPAWQFYSMPESIVGGGKTLEEARAEYQDALRFALETADLPLVHEYIEREIGNLGIWLRIPVGQGDYDKLLRDAERQIDPDDRDWFLAHPTAGGDPVIVNALPDAPLSSLLEQMSGYDSLILAMRYHGDEKVKNIFLVIAGAATESDSTESPTSFESMGLSPDSPLRDLAAAALKSHVTTVSAPALC